MAVNENYWICLVPSSREIIFQASNMRRCDKRIISRNELNSLQYFNQIFDVWSISFARLEQIVRFLVRQIHEKKRVACTSEL